MYKTRILERAFILFCCIYLFGLIACTSDKKTVRLEQDFIQDWKFMLGDISNAIDSAYDDSSWRSLQLPHDWSIEGEFDEQNPAGVGGGSLPGGIGWYRKTFTLPESYRDKHIVILFEGIYRNSEVWINGHALGTRPNGYISFTYDLTPYLFFDSRENVMAVKVDNSEQPNSRWYSGSGIFREVKLIVTNNIYVPYSGTHIRNNEITPEGTTLFISTTVANTTAIDQDIKIITGVYSPSGQKVLELEKSEQVKRAQTFAFEQEGYLKNLQLWSLENPSRYKSVTVLESNGKIIDRYETVFGVRAIEFKVDSGFFLNKKSVKINGVCLHHDLGCLGTAFNKRAAERQLQIMQEMGVNAIRTSHNPPDPTLLDLCDSMGIMVMDEMFDMWKKSKTKYDYSLNWDEWHEQDLKDFIKRDRNHPSVICWSIGNEIGEQWDSTGTSMTSQLTNIVRALDDTRPITTANNEATSNNYIIKSEALDLIGYNYNHQRYSQFPSDFPGKKLIATETVSGLATRGYYEMPCDSIRRWPIRWDIPFLGGDSAHNVSAYDNVSAPWGSTHEETLREVKKYPFVSGQFIWTGFDYIGEPTPYLWPSRSSYFGIVDLAGFPKDVFYLYQSEWTNKPVLHLFPHWNWKEGEIVDVVAYYNMADEVELFLNNKSLGIKKKGPEDFHVMWRIPFEPGVLRAVSRKNDQRVLVKEIHTAGKPSRLNLVADRIVLKADTKDLSFITIRVLDQDGNLVPDSENLIQFKVSGAATIEGVDNGSQVSLESFKDDKRKAFHGMALLVVRSKELAGDITIEASADGLEGATLMLKTK